MAEVENFGPTLARFPGLTRAALFRILRGDVRADAGTEQFSLLPPIRVETPVQSAAADANAGPLALVVSTDGASRGNPGPASIGVVLAARDGRVVDEIARTLGRATNNVAEYEAVRAGLARALELGAHSVELRADSELVIKQLLGAYRVRNAALLPIYEAVKALEKRFPKGVGYKHVRREFNAAADALANRALDEA